MAMATLSIDIEAKLAKLEEGMTRAQYVTERAGAQMAGAMSKASAAAKNLVVVLAAAGIGSFVQGIIRGVDALNDFKDATGTSVGNASALEDIALRTGTSFDTAQTALIKFNAALAESAKKDSDAARIFEKLGLNASELRRIDPAEALLKTAQALRGWADDGDKARIVQELFGKSVREVAPFLKDLAEKGQLVGTVTEEAAKAAEVYRQRADALTKDLTDLARTLTGPVVEALNTFSAQAKKEGFWSALFKESDEDLAKRTLAARVNRIIKYQEERAQAVRDGNKELVDALQVKIDLQRGAMQFGAGSTPTVSARDQLRGMEAASAELPKLGALGDKGKPSQALEDALKRIEGTDEKKIARIRAELAALIALQKGGTKVPAGAFADLANDLAKVDPAARAAAEAMKFYDDAVEKAADARTKADEAARRAVDQMVEGHQALREEIELIGKSADEQARITRERISAQIATKESQLALEQEGASREDQIATLKREIEALRERRALVGERAAAQRGTENLPQIADDANKANDAARELGMTFSSAFEDAIVNGSKFSDVLKGIEKDLLRILTRKLVTEPLAESISGAIKGGSGGGVLDAFFGGGTKNREGGAAGGGILASLFGIGAKTAISALFGAAGSDVTNTAASEVFKNFAGGFAKGGYIPPGQFGMTGENGVELVSGGRSGKTITPMGRSQTFVYNAAPGGSRMSSQQQAQDFFRQGLVAVGRNG